LGALMRALCLMKKLLGPRERVNQNIGLKTSERSRGLNWMGRIRDISAGKTGKKKKIIRF